MPAFVHRARLCCGLRYRQVGPGRYASDSSDDDTACSPARRWALATTWQNGGADLSPNREMTSIRLHNASPIWCLHRSRWTSFEA